MLELGFKQDASASAKEAFIKHLIKASAGVHVVTPTEEKEILDNPEKVVQLKNAQQLSFDFEDDSVKRKPASKAVS